ncbi:MAG: ATP-binding protein [Permianibacter sp.]
MIRCSLTPWTAPTRPWLRRYGLWLAGAALAATALAYTGTSVQAQTEEDCLCLRIADRGDGLGNSSNLFVPFYSTKNGGSSIGLVLSRQIVEAHDGSLQLRNRDGGGCVAEIRLPLARQPGH